MVFTAVRAIAAELIHDSLELIGFAQLLINPDGTAWCAPARNGPVCGVLSADRVAIPFDSSTLSITYGYV